MSKKYKAAEVISEAVGMLVSGCKIEMGVFIGKRHGAFGVFYAGEKHKSNDEYLEFVKEAINRLQKIAEETEKGDLDISDPATSKFIYNSEQNKFITFEEDEANENGEMGMSA